MKIKKYYKLVIIGLLIILFVLLYKNKEPFVEQVGNYIYSSTTYRNKTFNGINIGDKINDITSEDCFKLCISTSGCSGYVMDNSYCYLKKGNISKENLDNKDESKTIIINKFKGKITLDKNKNSSAITIREYNDKSYTDCYNYCINNDNCHGFVTNFDIGNGPGKCQLKTNDLYNISKVIPQNGKIITTIHN